MYRPDLRKSHLPNNTDKLVTDGRGSQPTERTTDSPTQRNHATFNAKIRRNGRSDEYVVQGSLNLINSLASRAQMRPSGFQHKT